MARPSVFVSKTDPFDFIEVERIEPVPDGVPANQTPGGQPGRYVDIRYRTYQSDDEWTTTSKGHLSRDYRPLSGIEAKNLVSPNENWSAPEAEPEDAALYEEEPEEVQEEEEVPSAAKKPITAARRRLSGRKAKAG